MGCGWVAQQPVAHVLGRTGQGAVEVLHHDRDPAERPVGEGAGRLGPGGLEPRVDHGVQRGVGGLDARDGGVDQLGRGGVTRSDQGREGGGVGEREVVGHGAGA